MTPALGIAIPAAGAARRMGGVDKLIEPIAGTPLLRRQAELALGLEVPVFIGLSPDHPARRAALQDLVGCVLQDIPDCHTGLSGSLRAAAVWAQRGGFDGVMILLADMPDIEIDDLITLRDAFGQDPDAICRACDETGAPGHPVILPARLFAKLAELHGDMGARALIGAESPKRVPLPGRRATTDLDTPQDWATWRARTGL